MTYLNSLRCLTNSLLHVSFTSIKNYSSTSGKGRLRKGTICQPQLAEAETKSIKNVVGLHVGSNYVSWVAIEVSKNEITQMGITNFPEHFEKMNLNGLSLFASQTFQMLPSSKYYIIEESLKTLCSNAGRQQLLFQSSRMQYVAMLVALINSEVSAGEECCNKILLLKHKLAARLFGLLVGAEVISSTKMVTEYLNQHFPPRFTPLKCSDNLKSQYSSRNRIEQEMIGYSLMAAITFLELIVWQNEKCIEFVGISTILSKAKKSKENVASNIVK